MLKFSVTVVFEMLIKVFLQLSCNLIERITRWIHMLGFNIKIVLWVGVEL